MHFRKKLQRLLEMRSPLTLVPRRVVVLTPGAGITEALRAALSVVVHLEAVGHSRVTKMATKPVLTPEDTMHVGAAAEEDTEDTILDTIGHDAIRRRMRTG